MHDKYKIWLPPGGHIELDEDPEHAAIREAQEEVGLKVRLVGKHGKEFSGYLDKSDGEGRDLLLPHFMNRHRINDTHEHISFEFFATSETRDVRQGDKEISDEIRWFTRGELEDPGYGITEQIQFYAKTALEELGNK